MKTYRVVSFLAIAFSSFVFIACDGYECATAGGPACDPDPNPACDTVKDCEAHTEIALAECMRWSCGDAHECEQVQSVSCQDGGAP